MPEDQLRGFSPAAQVAVSSPTRLAALLLCEQQPYTPRELGEALNMSRQVMQIHINRLKDAGLVREAARTPTRGGTTVSYTAVHQGWGSSVAAMNALAAEPPSGAGA